ncbi:MAG: AHH domain-containing protein [Rubrivivax sp.]|nr:AHH domain-containing protein [Rubrivivax sp.]
MAKKKGSKGPHSYFKESNKLHDSVGSFDGGACLNGHLSRWVERDSCSYRWQGIKRAKERAELYNIPSERSWWLDESGFRWLSAESVAKGRSGKILKTIAEGIKKGMLKRKVEVRNFTNGFLPYSNQVHHVLPNSALRKGIEGATGSKANLIKDITDGLLEEPYNINFKINMLILPEGKRESVILGLPTHCGDHPGYTAKVMASVKAAMQPYALAAKKGEPHGESDFEDIKDELHTISNDMYDAVVDYGQASVKGASALSVNELPTSVFSVLA